jgi:hypothetical protein
MATIASAYKLTFTAALAALNPPLKCLLMKNTHTIAASDDDYADIIANECSGAGYTAGGVALTTPASSAVGANAKFTAATTTFSAITLTARYAVIYNPTTGKIISQHDLGADKSPAGGSIVITWHASGILTVS